MPSPDSTYAIVREIDDEHGGTVLDITTTEELYIQEKTVRPGTTARIVRPDPNYDVLSQVTVEPIPPVSISTLRLADGYLRGVLTKRHSLTGILSSRGELHGTIGRNSNMPYYEGDYVVDPSAHHDILLHTNGLAMHGDVLVNKIYSAEVSNPAGGYTFYIAEH